MTNTVENIHRFWFGVLKGPEDMPHEKVTFWFMKNERTDEYIREAYLTILNDAIAGQFDFWKNTPRGYLCLILVLDQFPRHIYRNKPTAFAQDLLALKLASEGLEDGIDQNLYPIERCFFYMPLQHSEDLSIQEKSVKLYSSLAEEVHKSIKPSFQEFHKYAKMHLDVIKEFGRFPHRNTILDRESTPEEEAFLKMPGSSF
jgi:uncharacterized protein (DUF924 family)